MLKVATTYKMVFL